MASDPVSRREKIEAMLREEPHDTFLRYSLAMELDKSGEHAASLGQFQELMAAQPPHIPSFFMAAKLLTRLREVEQARSILRDGIEQARRQGDHHAASEMGELLMALGAERS
jgi:tetratricopeptide (TPR) repeat protein